MIQMSDSYNGSCMCGSVQFSFTEAPRFVKDCVCESCRKAHGASSVCWVGVKNQRFHIDSGASSLSWYQSSSSAERGFCSGCGTRLFFRSSNWPGETHMALACISEPHNLSSTGVSFEEELPSWTSMAPK